MGKVYLAEDTRIARHVAIKIVLTEPQPYPNSAAVQEASRLFRREMKAIAMLDHRNILNLIGLIAIYTNNSTEVTYRDARVWTL